MKKKDSTSLVSRLKKQYGDQPAEAEGAPVRPIPPASPGETDGHDLPGKKKDAKRSILTPAYLAETPDDVPAPTVMHYKFQIPHAIHRQLPVVLKDASPFSTPLTAGKLIDLVYCEVQKSPALQNRMREMRDTLTLGNFRKSSTINLPIYIGEFVKEFFGATIVPAISLFLMWCVTDWDFIRTHLTYRGLK